MLGNASASGVAQSLSLQIAAFQALLLAVSGLHKVQNRLRLRAVVRKFAGVPERLAPVAVYAVAAYELSAALMLCLRETRTVGALAAALLYSTYLALICTAMRKGRGSVDCGCSFGTSQRPLGRFEVARNAVLIVMALFVAVAAGDGGVGFTPVLAGLAMLSLYGALDQVMALQPAGAGEVI